MKSSRAIGAGGMGEVYRARDTRLDRTVAIKVLPAALRRDPAAARAVRARGARHLRAEPSAHLRALRRRRPGRRTRISSCMEYLEGETLADAARPRAAAASTRRCASRSQIADALDTAHRAGIVHRDLKPAQHHADARRARSCSTSASRKPPRRSSPPRSVDDADDAARALTAAGHDPRHAFSTWRRSRSKGSRPTRAPTSSRSARCCTRC